MEWSQDTFDTSLADEELAAVGLPGDAAGALDVDIDATVGSVLSAVSVELAQRNDHATDAAFGMLAQRAVPPPALVSESRGLYFRRKAALQQEEDAAYLDWAGRTKPPVFAGCVVYVNGFTRPGAPEIHRTVVEHGGVFLHHLGRKSAATHIVALLLTPRKRLEFARRKVVRPEWVVDSVARGAVVDWRDYSVIANDYGQGRLEDMVGKDRSGGAGTGDGPGSSDGLGSSDEENLADLTLPEHLTGEDDVEDQNGTMPTSALHPDFLTHYFSRLRLHHLSTWKTALRSRQLERVLAQPPVPPSTRSPIVLHVDYDCFFVAVSSKSHPELRLDPEARPACVSHGGRTSDVASCNYAARAAGVRNGMWLHQAKRSCPDLVVLLYDFPAYEAASEALYAALMALGAAAILPISVDEALVDISLINDTPEAVANSLRESIYAASGCHASVGIGRNVLMARLALRQAKPRGQFSAMFSNEHDMERFLDPLSVASLPGVGRLMVRKLESLTGATPTVKHLRCLSLHQLQTILGAKTGERLFGYGRGVDSTLIDVAANPELFNRKSVLVDVNYGIRFHTMEHVDEFLTRLAGEVAKRLAEVDMRAGSLTLRLARRAPDAPVNPPKHMGMGKCEFVSRSAAMGVATREPGLLAGECKSLYRTIHVDPVELRGVAIQATRLKPGSDTSQGRIDQWVLRAAPPEIAAPAAATRSISAASNGLVYELPSDVDSEVLKELASPIQRKLRARQPTDTSHMPAQPESLDQIDWAVFAQLPEEVQAEIRGALPASNGPAVSSYTGGGSAADDGATPPAPVDVRNWAEPINTPPPFQHLENTPDILQLVVAWCQKAATPEPRDVEIFLSYTTRLIEQDKLARCVLVRRALATTVWSTGHHAYGECLARLDAAIGTALAALAAVYQK